jgi:acyl carrier protein
MRTAKKIRRFVDVQLLDPGMTVEGDPLADGLLDSLAIEQLIGFLEESFHLEFADEELVAENFASIETVADFVDAKRRAAR